MIVYDLIYDFFKFVFGIDVITINPYAFLTKSICFLISFLIFYLVLFYLPNKIIFKILHKGDKK